IESDDDHHAIKSWASGNRPASRKAVRHEKDRERGKEPETKITIRTGGRRWLAANKRPSEAGAAASMAIRPVTRRGRSERGAGLALTTPRAPLLIDLLWSRSHAPDSFSFRS